jgi:hypothetical protein
MNCKPGDLAVVVDDNEPENVGLLVEVQDRIDSEWEDEPFPHWLVVSRGRPMLNRLYDDGVPLGEFEYSQEGYVADKDLRPIRPGDISDEEVRDLYAPKIPEAA